MPSPRKEPLITDQIYHVFNHTIGDDDIFESAFALRRFSELIMYYRFQQNIRFSQYKDLPPETKASYFTQILKKPPIVEIYAMALMPNHYHLLLKQKNDNGIKKFTSDIQNGLAKYFNLRTARLGSLFVRPFKSIRIKNEEALLHVSRYIHLNPVTAFLTSFEKLKNYQWNSYQYYVNQKPNSPINTELIIKLLGSKEKYNKFIENQIDYQRSLSTIKRYLLEL